MCRNVVRGSRLRSCILHLAATQGQLLRHVASCPAKSPDGRMRAFFQDTSSSSETTLIFFLVTFPPLEIDRDIGQSADMRWPCPLLPLARWPLGHSCISASDHPLAHLMIRSTLDDGIDFSFLMHGFFFFLLERCTRELSVLVGSPG
ncbi:hypothetical protein M440DRAFT_326609 [Trichoderma longibrachiatum ATCC 18648]|uniref:Uncharacterized protein n=1 Tax=Trichoderma longibrachiatum ATCC 18648 TaxID=983965 RepID=A0A2T4C269_TRILO|nr:hypothetical protein M440DRAFT_326609 [Trichoderma longibrachiatum ATCC 18648]